MPTEQGSRVPRLAGSLPFALAIFFSVALHLLAASLIPWPGPESAPPFDPVARMELRLQAQVPQKSHEPATTTSNSADPQREESKPETTQTTTAAEKTSEVPPEPTTSQPQLEKPRPLEINALVKETVETMQGDAQQLPLGEAGPRIGDSVFDPRLRERIRQSKDINTAAAEKHSRVRSWQEPGGDWYVEVGDGGCFHVRQSMQPGAPDTWEFTRCRSGNKLELNPKPYTELD